MGLRERTRARVGAGVTFSAVVVALLAASAPAAAAPKRITGKLDKPGYTVIALAADGEARTDRTKWGRFSLRPPAKSVTLHLRDADGTYGGPIVMAAQERGKQTIVGVRSGADLGKVEVNARRGFARVSEEPSRKAVDESRLVRARNGAPIGSGVFGRVRSKRTHGGIPGDRDLDGVPNPLDIDDDGDLVLDDNDRSIVAGASQAGGGAEVHTGLILDPSQTVNANPRDASGAPVFSDAEIEAALSSAGGVLSPIPPPGAVSAELDCAGSNQNPSRPEGLPYCSLGGEASRISGFPACCDPDGDGFGTFTGPPVLSSLVHRATADQIKTGDVLVQHVTTAGNESQCPPPPLTSNPNCASYPTVLQYIFVTVPTLASYNDGAGNTATLSYPREIEPALPVADGPDADEDIEVTLTFWRPQRKRLAGDPDPQSGDSAVWTDIGRLTYGAGWSPPAGTTSAGDCPQGAFFEDNPDTPAVEDDPDLTPYITDGTSDFTNPGGFVDHSLDVPANPANTFTFTLNVSRCLTSPWNPGETRSFTFTGRSPNGAGFATQTMGFKRQ